MTQEREELEPFTKEETNTALWVLSFLTYFEKKYKTPEEKSLLNRFFR